MTDHDRRPALAVLYAGFFMIILDTTIVNVALPSIRADLGFSDAGVAWVVNAYLVAFGGLLLLAGRTADLVGRRVVFLAGLGVFVAASALAGLATSPGLLVGARFVQGAGGALASAPILGIIVGLVPERAAQARAISGYAFVGSAGATLGLVLGGLLTEALSWHWIFFVNLPIGALTVLAARRVLPADRGLGVEHGADVAGALLAVATVTVGVLAIIETAIVPGVVAVGLLGAFLVREARTATPLVPLRIFRSRELAAANAVQTLGIVGMFGQQFLVALYLQEELGYSPVQIGLATVPIALVIGVVSLGFSARILMRFGARGPLVVALTLIAAGLGWLAALPATFAGLLGPFVVMGLGAGLAMPAWTTLGMGAVAPQDGGLASGLLNTTQQLGAALGVAILAAVAAEAGYGAALLVAAGAAGAGIVVTVLALSTRRDTGTPRSTAARPGGRRRWTTRGGSAGRATSPAVSPTASDCPAGASCP